MLKPTTENHFNFESKAITVKEIIPALKENTSTNGVEKSNADKSILVILTKNAPFMSPKGKPNLQDLILQRGLYNLKKSYFQPNQALYKRRLKATKYKFFLPLLNLSYNLVWQTDYTLSFFAYFFMVFADLILTVCKGYRNLAVFNLHCITA